MLEVFNGEEKLGEAQFDLSRYAKFPQKVERLLVEGLPGGSIEISVKSQPLEPIEPPTMSTSSKQDESDYDSEEQEEEDDSETKSYKRVKMEFEKKEIALKARVEALKKQKLDLENGVKKI